MRDVLRGEGTALALRGLLDERKLREVGGGTGRKNLALDLTLLYKAMDDSWAAIEGKTRVTREEIETAARIGQYIVRLVGIRREATQTLAAVADTRLRIFTLFVQAYDDARRAIHFLRWKERDADEIAPSLFSTRGGGRRQGARTDAPPADGAGNRPGPAAPTTGAAPTSAGGAGSAAPAGGAHAASSASTTSGNAGAGGRMPGGSPFLA